MRLERPTEGADSIDVLLMNFKFSLREPQRQDLMLLFLTSIRERWYMLRIHERSL